MRAQDAPQDKFDLDCLDKFKIVGYCLIGKDRYPIVEINNSIRTLTSSRTSRIDRQESNYLSLFEINGQNLAIIIAAEQVEHTSADPASFLTKRESEIATLVSQGNSNKQIAHQLHISEWTVSTHLRRVFIKLGVDSRAAMVYRIASTN